MIEEWQEGGQVMSTFTPRPPFQSPPKHFRKEESDSDADSHKIPLMAPPEGRQGLTQSEEEG